jgi:hypothetical protein
MKKTYIVAIKFKIKEAGITIVKEGISFYFNQREAEIIALSLLPFFYFPYPFARSENKV